MSMPTRISVVGDRERPAHYYLPPTANCMFWGEYTPYEHTNGQKWNFSPTNRLISNLKKKMDRQGTVEWQYKVRAIQTAAQAFVAMYDWPTLMAMNPAFVPMPPSKARSDAMYDPRMLQVLQQIAVRSGRQLDIRDCLSFDGRHAASHESDDRPSPEELYQALQFDPVQGRPDQPPGLILLFDDMLTTGAHFVAASRKLGDAMPQAPIAGQFIARRLVPDAADQFEPL